MRIGILGGTFNPVHNGHLYIARQALKRLKLDRVIFIPAYIPPHKKIFGNVKPGDRLRMLNLAIAGNKCFKTSSSEIKRKGKSYSINTARYFKRKFGRGSELFFLIGGDSLKGLKKWRDFLKLSKLVRFVVFPRPGFTSRSKNLSITGVKVPGKDISSTGIRRLAGRNKPIKGLVPGRVLSYIKDKQLYK